MTHPTTPPLKHVHYRLYERPVHPELFDLAAQQPIQRKHFEASVWLADQGHIVSFHHEELTLAEVFIDATCDLPRRGVLERWTPQGEKAFDRLYCGRIRYRMNCQVEFMTPKIYAQMHKDVLAKGRAAGLCASFPQRISDDGVVPFSCVDFEIATRSLHLFAYHALPQHTAMLKVQTLIELA